MLWHFPPHFYPAKCGSLQRNQHFQAVLLELSWYRRTVLIPMHLSAVSKMRFCRCMYSSLMSSPTDCELRPNLGPATILIAEGQYQETLNITRKGPSDSFWSVYVIWPNAHLILRVGPTASWVHDSIICQRVCFEPCPSMEQQVRPY